VLVARDHPFQGMQNLLARPNMESERLEPPGLMTTSVASRGPVGGWGDEADAICSRLIREFVALLAERDARRRLRVWNVDPIRTIESEARRRRGWIGEAVMAKATASTKRPRSEKKPERSSRTGVKATAKAGRADVAALARVSGAAATTGTLGGASGAVDRADRIDAGRAMRKDVPRSSHGDWEAASDRPDPVAVLVAQGESRVHELLPIRYGRMAESPFGFFRGAAAGMAADLASTPSTGVAVQLCGDGHLVNFGGFATPERRLIFDVNDFDETLPGPWEWARGRSVPLVGVARPAHTAGEDDRKARLRLFELRRRRRRWH
jgi:hypothetical protein